MGARKCGRSSAITAVVLLGSLCSVASANPFPTKPVRIVVPFAPGGLTDMVARAVGQKVATALAQPVIVDNRPGAAGNIGTALVAKAPADGYTLLLVSSSFVINPSGLALRGDPRAAAPARDLLAAHAGEEVDSVWTRHLLAETASHLEGA